MAVLRPKITTVKALFALSGNVCAYPGCENALTKPGWGEVNADLAHIHGEKPRAARWSAAMTDEDRRRFENLILLCPGCHRLIDRLDPVAHPPEALIEIKAQHEGRAPDVSRWATPADLDRFAAQLVQQFAAQQGDLDDRRVTPVPADFGDRLRRAREAEGLTHHALGRMASVSGKQVKEIEERKIEANLLTSTYNKLVRALKLDGDL